MNYPMHTLLLILIPGTASGPLYWLFVQAALRRTAPGRTFVWQIGSAIFLAALYLLALNLSLTRRYTTDSTSGARLVPVLIGLMVGVNGLLLIGARRYRQMVDAIPLHWLIGSHLLRVLPGAAFLALSDMGWLPPEMALQAGYGDLLAGILAPAAAYLVYRQAPYARGVALAWNIFGLLDLANALYKGLTTIAAWLATLSSAGQSVDFINLFLMLPTYMVPLFLVSHVWIFRRLGAPKVDAARTHELGAPA